MGNTYEVVMSVLGATVTVPVTIVPSPVKSIEIEPISIIEHTNGFYTSGWDSQLQQNVEYYCYNDYNLPIKGKIVLQDDTEIVLNGSSFTYNGQWKSVDYQTNQSATNPWTVGNTYEVVMSALGATVTVPVTIVPSPVKSIEIEPISIIEHTNGSYTSDWDSQLQQNVEYYYYSDFPINGKIILQDDTEIIVNNRRFRYEGEYQWLSYSAPSQSATNPWTVGNSYELTVSFLGKTATAKVTITPSNISSIEILKSKNATLNGNNSYTVPDFTYRIYYKDGTSVIKYYFGHDDNIQVSTDQENHPWTIGGVNTVTVCIGPATATFNAKICDSTGYEYIEQDGGLFITDCVLLDETLEIPSEIDGKPVIGVMGLGRAVNSAKNVVIPDSVVYLSNSVFASWSASVETVSIGAGVADLSVETFGYNDGIQCVEISPDNESYVSVDGVVYDKQYKTVVYYPPAKGNEFSVPDFITNVDIFYQYELYEHVTLSFGENSSAFIQEDGITYSADKTKIITCDPEKTGAYIMPDSVTTIVDGAFMYSSLDSVTMSDNVTTIVYQMFSGSKISQIKLPKNLATIESRAFLGSSLASVEFPATLTEIGGGAFEGTSLTSVTIPASVKSIGSCAFAYCDDLVDLTIQKGEDIQIGSGAFEFCHSLKNVSLPDNMTSIPSEMFGWSALENVTIPASVTRIEACAFCGSNLKTIIIPDSVVSIGQSAFSGCNLENIVFGKNLTVIETDAFFSNSLTHLELPKTVTEITYWAFGANPLESVSIPHGIKKISNSAFEHSPWYESLSDGYYNEYLLYAISADYNLEDNVTEYKVKDGTKVIADMAFQNMTNLTSVELPEGLITIGEKSFYNCTSLTSIHIPASVEYIAPNAFEGCTSLTDVTSDPNNHMYCIEDNALYNYDKTELITCYETSDIFIVPDSVQRIAPDAFANCNVPKILIRNDQIELNKSSLSTYPYVDELYAKTEGREKSVRTIICKENSTAYLNAEDNLLEVETDPYLDVIIESKTVSAGKEFTVAVDVTTGCPFSYLSLTPVFAEGLRLVKVENATLLSEFNQGQQQYMWTSDNNVESDGRLMTFTFVAESGEVEFPVDYKVDFIVREVINTDEQLLNAYVTPGMIHIVDIMYGDATGDGVIDGRDVVRLKKYLADYDYTTGKSNIAIELGADATGDGVIDGRDVVRLKKYLADFNYETGESTIILGK